MRLTGISVPRAIIRPIRTGTARGMAGQARRASLELEEALVRGGGHVLYYFSPSVRDAYSMIGAWLGLRSLNFGCNSPVNS